MRKIIKVLFITANCIFLLWIFLSWAEIVSKNLKPNPTYHQWNAFELLVKEVTVVE